MKLLESHGARTDVRDENVMTPAQLLEQYRTKRNVVEIRQ